MQDKMLYLLFINLGEWNTGFKKTSLLWITTTNNMMCGSGLIARGVGYGGEAF